MITRLLILLLILAASRSACANGGAFQVGVPSTGNLAASDGKTSTNVSIQEENLRIDLHQEFAEVELRYQMHNDGPAVEQDFYFPVERWAEMPGEGKPTDLENYRLTADGAEISWKNTGSTKTAKGVMDESWGEFPPSIRSWKQSRILFREQQSREILIRYRAAYGGHEDSVSDDIHASDAVFAYSFSPASTWKEPIGTGHVAINLLCARPEEVSIVQTQKHFKRVSDTRYEWDFHHLRPTLADDLKVVVHPSYDRFPTGKGGSWIIQGKRYFYLHTDYEAQATSTLKPEGEYSYDVDHINGQTEGAVWSEGVEGDGIGESITLKVKRPLPLDALLIIPGYRSDRSEALWGRNNRVAQLEITLNGEHTFTANIPDEKFAEPYPLPVRGYSKPVENIRLTIKGVHRGTAARDTCISLIELKARLAQKPEIRPAR